MKIDLHIHSTASDGRATPAEVVRMAADLGMRAIAITDHDSVEGIEEALAEARRFPRLMVIPGVELGTDVPRGEMHILGYFIDHTSSELRHKLQTLRTSRSARGQQMVAKLVAHGVHLDWGKITLIAGGASIGRPHLAQAMMEQGYTFSVQEAFDKYIGDNGPCFVEREKFGPVESVELLAKAGGLAVLAHPAQMVNLDRVLSELMPVGLVGIEVFYKDYDRATTDRLRGVARKHGLVCCGGSDYHGFEDEGNRIGNCDVPPEAVERLVALRKQRQLRHGESK
ncbi:MAG: PHP domain-containing protein [Chloroflexi bacterium]|nr:PHP domain-containing protein [Chloroflexota bacterium]